MIEEVVYLYTRTYQAKNIPHSILACMLLYLKIGIIELQLR